MFYFDKLKYCSNRYEQLVKEMQNRNYNPNPIATEKLLEWIDNKLLKNYIPTEEAIKENRNRISLRLKKAAQRKG